MQRVEPLNEVGEVVIGGVAEDAEGAGARVEVGDRSDGLESVVDSGDRAFGVCGEGESRLGRGKSPRSPHEESGADLPLESGDEF